MSIYFETTLKMAGGSSFSKCHEKNLFKRWSRSHVLFVHSKNKLEIEGAGFGNFPQFSCFLGDAGGVNLCVSVTCNFSIENVKT